MNKLMKKLAALLLVLMLALGAVGALAEVETDTYDWYSYDEDYNPVEKIGKIVSTYDTVSGAWADEYINLDGKTELKYEYDGDGKFTEYIYNSAGQVTTIEEYNYNPKTGEETHVSKKGDGSVVEATYENEKGGITVDSKGKITSAYAATPAGCIKYSKGKWYNMNGQVVSPADLAALGFDVDEYLEMVKALSQPPVRKQDITWYSHNTACVVGISLRDEFPGLTEKWYNVLPVDLSKDGTQTFKMAASNLYYLGNVTVTVAGDNVTTTYEFPSGRNVNVYPEEECLAWFTSIGEITHDYLENPVSKYKFGTAVSKAQDLNGQDTALLFVCNHVTYRVPLTDNVRGIKAVRFWRNHYKMADYFANVKTLQERVETEHAEKAAAAETSKASASNP